jgi:glucose/arabinose dehydrogenase
MPWDPRFHMRRFGRLLAIVVTMTGCGGSGGSSGAPKAACSVATVASGMQAPYGILAESGSYLVTGGGLVYSIQGSAVSNVAKLTAPSGSGLLRYGGALFVLDNPPGKLLRLDNAFKSTEVASGLGNPVDMDVDGDAFIIDDYDNRKGPPGGPGGNNGRVLRVRQDGTVAVITASGLGGPGAVNVQPEGYYVTDYDGGRLLRISKDKGEITVLATGLGNPVGIRFYKDAFFMADFAGASSGGRILKASKDGSVQVLNASGLGAAAGIFIEGKDILVTDLIGGRLLRVGGCLE